ncbi:MAG: ATP-dependent DNA helicase RecG [bacterium]|nr:ATP-dependent DNA helicase RecG [bacterium]
MLGLNTPLSKIPAIGPRFLKSLGRLGLHTVGDLVWHFPNRYEDFSQTYRIAELEPGQQATIQGVVRRVDLRRSFRRKMTIVEAVIEDDSGRIRAVWFNQPYLKNTLRPGRRMNFSGKVSASENDIYFSHPDYEVSFGMQKVGDSPSQISRSETWEGKHTGRLVPIYPETRGLTSRALRFIVQPILKNLETLQEFLPKEVLEKQYFPEINEAIHKIHFPDSIDEVANIRRRFAFENIFLLQLNSLQQKFKLSKQRAPKIEVDSEYLKKLLGALPFELTESQHRSLSEILGDLVREEPMNRLLQGDVGSGKTIVAAIATIMAARQGLQAAFMAPTEVLASQHFKTMKSLFRGIQEKLGESLPAIGLLTASGARIFFADGLETELKKSQIQKKINDGEVEIMIGTHALIQKTVQFKNLGLVIVDEQHRFGVKQRAMLARGLTQTDTPIDAEPSADQRGTYADLRKSGPRESASSRRESALVPHFLSMSATPIPRTLMLTIFGDLDISIIDEMPAGRKEIMTKVVTPENRVKAYGFIKGQVLKGRQAFVICPRIEMAKIDSTETEKSWQMIRALEVKSVKEEYAKLSTRIFPDLRVDMLHGQMKPKEKEKVMNDFSTGRIDVLVSTSVVEVGVDVPNATIMMIEGSDRFGLAQLYQFRGRVGRGEHQSFCFLFTDSGTESINKRLKAILRAKNGFELAEEDLKIRGPGQFLGESQTGLPDIAMEALQDVSLIKSSRDIAEELLKKDQDLKKYRPLSERLKEFQKTIHQE